MDNRERAEQRANELDQQIIETLRAGHCFRVEAGAGAGKTYSLMKVIDWLENEKKKNFTKFGQQVACITYTNIAVDVIKSRLKSEGFIQPCTIHNFAWGLMKRFQSSLLRAVENLGLLPAHEDGTPISINEISSVTYELGVRYIRDNVLYLYHDDVIKLFVSMLDNAKFRSFLGKNYPIVLIDEYQDSFKSIMDKFLCYFVDAEQPPQLGLFGDSWQTIYSSMGACGEVNSDKIKVINKEANFRSQEVIVQVLNHIRPTLPQITALDENDGKVLVITTDDYTGERQKGYYKGELPNDVLFQRIDYVRKKIEVLGWTGRQKTLMLTHKMLAKEQHYDNLLDILGDHLKDADDEHYLFFRDRVEAVFRALDTNNPKMLFDALGLTRQPINSQEQKKEWKKFYRRLSICRQGRIADVLELVKQSYLIGIPDKIDYWLSVYRKNENENEKLFYGKSIKTFYDIAYKEVLNAIEFQKPESEFSTDHGVKGEEYDSVLLIIGRGWNNYKFDEILYKNSTHLDGPALEAYIRNRNLFYVCCSRAIKNLALFITVPINNEFRAYLNNVFGEENIMNYTNFMNLK